MKEGYCVVRFLDDKKVLKVAPFDLIRYKDTKESFQPSTSQDLPTRAVQVKWQKSLCSGSFSDDGFYDAEILLISRGFETVLAKAKQKGLKLPPCPMITLPAKSSLEITAEPSRRRRESAKNSNANNVPNINSGEKPDSSSIKSQKRKRECSSSGKKPESVSNKRAKNNKTVNDPASRDRIARTLPSAVASNPLVSTIIISEKKSADEKDKDQKEDQQAVLSSTKLKGSKSQHTERALSPMKGKSPKRNQFIVSPLVTAQSNLASDLKQDTEVFSPNHFNVSAYDGKETPVKVVTPNQKVVKPTFSCSTVKKALWRDEKSDLKVGGMSDRMSKEKSLCEEEVNKEDSSGANSCSPACSPIVRQSKILSSKFDKSYSCVGKEEGKSLSKKGETEIASLMANELQPFPSPPVTEKAELSINEDSEDSFLSRANSVSAKNNVNDEIISTTLDASIQDISTASPSGSESSSSSGEEPADAAELLQECREELKLVKDKLCQSESNLITANNLRIKYKEKVEVLDKDLKKLIKQRNELLSEVDKWKQRNEWLQDALLRTGSGKENSRYKDMSEDHQYSTNLTERNEKTRTPEDFWNDKGETDTDKSGGGNCSEPDLLFSDHRENSMKERKDKKKRRSKDNTLADFLNPYLVESCNKVLNHLSKKEKLEADEDGLVDIGNNVLVKKDALEKNFRDNKLDMTAATRNLTCMTWTKNERVQRSLEGGKSSKHPDQPSKKMATPKKVMAVLGAIKAQMMYQGDSEGPRMLQSLQSCRKAIGTKFAQDAYNMLRLKKD